MATANERLREARQKAGYATAADAARAMGVSSVTFASHENGGRGLRADTAQRYATFFRVPVEWLLYGNPNEKAVDPVRVLPRSERVPAELPAPNAVVGGYARFGRNTIPVYGLAAGGSDGRFILNGQRIADVICPPSLEHVPDAYAVQFHGTSMEPRYYAGEIGWVNPRAAIRSGDFVVVQLKPEEEGEPPSGYVKRFLSRQRDELRLEQLNPPEGEDRTLRFPDDQVISVHKIVMSGLG